MQKCLSESENGLQMWTGALPYAILACAIILSLMYFWFAVADRYTVFLYYHDMGPYYPDTSPFSRVTISRYWMTGLVASGAVMVLTTGLTWLLGRLMKGYHVPTWWRVWIVATLLLMIGIPWITMTVNWPTLPLRHAAQVTMVTILGLAFALLPLQLAAERPRYLIGLSLDGSALTLFLLYAVKAELVPRWLSDGRMEWIRMCAAVCLSGAVGLLLLTGLRTWRRLPVPSIQETIVASFCIAYLLMPLAHYIIGTNGYFYLSDSDNFFAQSWLLQLAVWLIAGILVSGVPHLWQHLLIWRRHNGLT
ncbi:MAG: hypothetical protein JXA33_23925 [Anaerolineae bacterium]|nr:hypothetical protein [Anaerolineae bacterium]